LPLLASPTQLANAARERQRVVLCNT